MADLETAGTQLLERIKQLMPEFEHADKAFDDAEKKIEEAVQSLRKKWDTTEERAEDFLKQLAEDRKDNEDEQGKSRSAIDELKKKVLDATQDARQKMDETKDEIDDFGEQGVKATEPKVEAIMKMVDETAKALEQKAQEIENELNQVCQQASDFFENDIHNSIEQFHRDSDDRHSQLYDWITQDAMPQMTAKHGDFHDKLDNFQQHLQDKMHETGQNSMTEAKSALDGCLGQHMETINQILGLGQTLSTVLSGLSGGVDAASGTVDTCRQTLETGVDITNVSTKCIIESISMFMDFAKKFSFL